jgi:hypothetical protein
MQKNLVRQNAQANKRFRPNPRSNGNESISRPSGGLNMIPEAGNMKEENKL